MHPTDTRTRVYRYVVLYIALRTHVEPLRHGGIDIVDSRNFPARNPYLPGVHRIAAVERRNAK